MLTRHTGYRALSAQPTPSRIDYRSLFDHTASSGILERRCTNDVISARDRSGHSIWSTYADGNGFLEYGCFGDDVAIVISDMPNGLSGQSTQLTTDGDWLHIQFRVTGAGTEIPSDQKRILVPSGTCAIFRCPDGSQTVRDFRPEPWKAVCLYVRPSSVEHFFGISAQSIASEFQWLVDEGNVGFRSNLMPIDMASRAVIRDVMNTNLEGDFRRSFLKSKVLELFCLTAHQMKARAEIPQASSYCLLSESSVVHAAINVMKLEIEQPLTLASLARRVGTNRSRLAELFREHTGETVQAYWRKLRLLHARELLSSQQLSVTEVAAQVGYASISSLTRAFVQEFGILPKDARISGA